MIDLSEALKIAADHFPKGPEAVAAQIGIEIRRGPLTGCGGWCIRNNAVAVIRINSLMPETRQRFTLAHELAHLLLGTESEVRSDEDFLGSDDSEEIAANQVAAELLLPRRCVEQIVCSPPVESSIIRKLGTRARVSHVMAACRITDLAQSIGLINAAVISFANNKVNWVWSKTLTVPHKEATDLLRKARGSHRGVYRAEYRSGETVVASTIGPDQNPCLFIQLLPTEVGNQKRNTEVLADLDAWLFGTDHSFRGQVNGCLSSFKKNAEIMTLDQAVEKFNDKYSARWTGAPGNRIRDPRGQQFVRLRLGEWCK